MNKKAKLILINLLLIPVLAFCQFSGKIEYGTEYLKLSADTSKVHNPHAIDFIVQRENNAKMALEGDMSYYIMKFNETGSITEKIPRMNVGNQLAAGDYLYVEYINLNGTPYVKKNRAKKDYFVEYVENFEWEIKNEYNEILGYKCRKAVTYFTDKEGDIKKGKPIVAWFSEDIPVAYSPFRYYGLPGLVLEINSRSRRHYLRKITLNKDITIDFPTEDKLLTKEEFKAKFD